MKAFEGWVLVAVLCLVGATSPPHAAAETRAVLDAPANALDMDSVEGFFCMVGTGGGEVLCRADGGLQFSVPGLAGAQRVALDAAGRAWIVRNPPPFSDEPGLFVEVDGEGMLFAELPPLAAGDYVDSLVLIGAPQMQQVPGVANPLPLRTPVVRTSYRRLYVYAWWSEAFAFTQDASGDVVDSGSNVSVSPGWYEIDDEIIENSGSRWLLASPATIPSGNGPFAQTLVSLSHARLGSDIRVSMILDDGGAPNVVPMHVKAALGGSLLFARFRFTQDALPLNQFGLNSNENGSWGNKPFFPRRFAWSPEFYVTTGGPYIAQLRRPGTDPIIPWTLIPSFDDPPNDPGFPYILTEHLPPSDAPTGNCVCPLSQCNCTDGRPSYWCNDLPQECYVFNDTNNVIDGCETQVEGGCYDPAFHHAFYKVVPADDFDVWGPYSNIKLWVLSEYTRMWGIQVEAPTAAPNFTGIDPWPDMMLEESGYRPVVDPTRGMVYEKLASGYAELPSEPLATQKMPLPRAQLALDVFVPSSASGWVGDVQMSFELAAAGISESYVGYAGLSSLQKGVWSTVNFNVPVQWRQAMLGDFPGVRFRTFVNTAAGGVRIGALRFQGTPTSGSRAPHQARLSGVRTTQTLDFETAPGWAGTNLEVATNSSAGQFAARVTSSGWTEMVSPSFFTSSLPAIGTKLSVDVFVPTPSPGSHWQGDIQAFLTCQNTSIQNAWIDWSGLQNLFSNEYNTVTLDMPQNIRSALQVPNRTCRIRLTVNTAPTSSAASFYVDRVGFRD